MERFQTLFDTDWRTHKIGEYILVDDHATRWWIHSDRVADFLDAYDANGQDYSLACAAVAGLKDDQVPDQVVTEACNRLGYSRPVACGW